MVDFEMGALEHQVREALIKRDFEEMCAVCFSNNNLNRVVIDVSYVAERVWVAIQRKYVGVEKMEQLARFENVYDGYDVEVGMRAVVERCAVTLWSPSDEFVDDNVGVVEVYRNNDLLVCRLVSVAEESGIESALAAYSTVVRKMFPTPDEFVAFFKKKHEGMNDLVENVFGAADVHEEFFDGEAELLKGMTQVYVAQVVKCVYVSARKIYDDVL